MSNYPYNEITVGTEAYIREALQPLVELGVAIDEPIKIILTTAPNEERWGCRICIARHGLSGANIPGLPSTREEFEQHRKEKHGA